jgi:hypothetical protein
MTLDLLSGFAEGTAATNRRLGSEMTRATGVGDARQSVRLVLAHAHTMAELWEEAKDVLRSPREKVTLLPVLSAVGEALESWLSFLGEFLKLLRDGGPPESAAGVRDLESHETEVRAAAATVRRWLEGLRRSRPVDAERLARAEEEAAAGRWVPLKEVRDRLGKG